MFCIICPSVLCLLALFTVIIKQNIWPYADVVSFLKLRAPALAYATLCKEKQSASAVNILGPVYTKCQRQRRNNSAMTLEMMLTLKTMELLQNGVATHFRKTALFSKRTLSLASSQCCRSIDTTLGVNVLATLVCSSVTCKFCFQTPWYPTYLPRWISWNIS